jgi:hypothetical protein
MAVQSAHLMESVDCRKYRDSVALQPRVREGELFASPPQVDGACDLYFGF